MVLPGPISSDMGAIRSLKFDPSAAKADPESSESSKDTPAEAAVDSFTNSRRFIVGFWLIMLPENKSFLWPKRCCPPQKLQHRYTAFGRAAVAL